MQCVECVEEKPIQSAFLVSKTIAVLINKPIAGAMAGFSFFTKPEDIFIQESEMLRKVRDTIDKLGIEAAKDMILKAPSPKLWRILGEAAMAALKLDAAEEAFIHCMYH